MDELENGQEILTNIEEYNMKQKTGVIRSDNWIGSYDFLHSHDFAYSGLIFVSPLKDVIV